MRNSGTIDHGTTTTRVSFGNYGANIDDVLLTSPDFIAMIEGIESMDRRQRSDAIMTGVAQF